ncbi:MAG: MFS transporter [Oscillospiraceae bacterium]|jgi:MFS family permease|nr:MFS transporter [Oscillospiraceae bacterium]
MRVSGLFNRSYSLYVRDNETLRMLDVIVLSAATGMFLFAATGGAAFTGLASALGAGEFAFGLISALPVLAGILQILASYLVEKTGRNKTIFMAGGVIQRVSWFAVAFIPYLFPGVQPRVLALIVLVTLAAMSGSFVGVTHMLLMAAVIPMDIRGRYITTRQRVSTLVSLIAGLWFAYILDHMPGFSGYTVVFAVGGVAGLADILMYARYKFPAAARSAGASPFRKTLRECFTAPKTRDYMLFWIFWSFANQICSPFFNKYAIDVLGLSFISIILLGQVTSNVLSLLVVSRWGVFIDRYGSAPLLLISIGISSLGILVWLPAVPGGALPLFLFNFIGGVFWCANDACMVNMQFSHTPETGRAAALAVYAVVTSLSTAAALITGGAVLEALAPVMRGLALTVFGTPFDHYKLLFTCALVLRVAVLAVFLPRVWNEKGFPTLRGAYGEAFGQTRARARDFLTLVRSARLRRRK